MLLLIGTNLASNNINAVFTTLKIRHITLTGFAQNKQPFAVAKINPDSTQRAK